MKLLTRTKTSNTGNWYKSEDGEEYWLRFVDRKYAGNKRKPKYFLDKIINKKTKYISGFFETKIPNIYSFDKLDPNSGMKIFYSATFKDGGSIMELQKN